MNRREALHTIASFDDLMKVKGDEPPLPGHTDDEAFRWCIESIEACLPAADKAGVMLALEMEGKEPAATAVPRSLDMLRSAFGG
jgi:hypothetical protein